MEQDCNCVCEPAGLPSAATNATANKILDEDRQCHDWYRFVLSFPPHLVRDYIDRFGLTPQDTVLDPFCGTGTTLVECKKQGIAGVGLEANPLVCFAAKTKVDWSPDSDGLLKHARFVSDAVLKALAQDGIEDTPMLLGSCAMPLNMRTLAREQQALLLKNSIRLAICTSVPRSVCAMSKPIARWWPHGCRRSAISPMTFARCNMFRVGRLQYC